MQQLVNAIIQFRNGLVYLLLLSCSIYLLQQQSAYHRSLIAKSGIVIGSRLNSMVSSGTTYLQLRELNDRLIIENKILLDQLLKTQNKFQVLDSLHFKAIPAQVIRNGFLNSYNYITIRGGQKQGILPEMGIVTAKGIVGVVQFVEKRYAQVISILNKDLQINAKLKNSNHFGSLVWSGKDASKMDLLDVPKTANVKEGDTIHTGGMSVIFPPDLPIGYVSSFYSESTSNFYDIEVTLFQDMTNLSTVYAIHYPQTEEINSVQKSTNE
jgi:rod shape-determining protein MreC